MKNAIKRYKLMGLLSKLNRFAPHIFLSTMMLITFKRSIHFHQGLNAALRGYRVTGEFELLFY